MQHDYTGVIERFRSKRIVVIGDLILDVYLKGVSSRLSPEAPVPVVDVIERAEVSGGAANTAMNLRALGAEVTLLSVIGMDRDGAALIKSLEEAGIETSTVYRHPRRRTIVKTRVMAASHVITRFDSGNEDPLDEESENMLIRFLETMFNAYDAVVLSDYNKGIITGRVLDCLVALQRRQPMYIAVDSKRLAFFREMQPSFVKPNYEEAMILLGGGRQAAGRADQLEGVGEALAKLTGATTIAVTLDTEGAIVFGPEGPVRCCAEAVPAPHVVGAGDTFVSAFVLAKISGADTAGASQLASAAAAIAVRKSGTACCDHRELSGYCNRGQKTVQSVRQLEHLVALYRAEGRRIVFTNGCFDILHSGHVSYLNRARQLGDVLIVGINDDASIRRLKGENRPINPLTDRVQVLAGLSAVDHLIAFGNEADDTPVPLISVVRPDLFVKGGDYTREKLPEATTVEEYGGEIVFLPLAPDHSTTQTIQKIYKTSTLAVA